MGRESKKVKISVERLEGGERGRTRKIKDRGGREYARKNRGQTRKKRERRKRKRKKRKVGRTWKRELKAKEYGRLERK